MSDIKNIKIIDNKICITTSEICEILNITKMALSNWEKDGCPKAARGWWSIKDVLAWRGMTSSGIKTLEDIQEKSLQEQKLCYEIQYKKFQSEGMDLKNAVARGDYILKTDIVSELQRFFVIFKRSCLGISKKVANEVNPFVGQQEAKRIEKMVGDVLNNSLEQLSISGVYNAKDYNSKTKKRK